MGKKRPRFRKPKDQVAQASTQQVDNRKPYEDIVKENEKFIEYYKTQNICPANEWDHFITSLKTDLPATFRITGSKGVAKKMLDIVQGQFIKNCLNEGSENEKTPNIFPLPWYPNKLAWQMELTRKDIRRVEAYYKLHNFLITETENGTISRQETVSMIPPLVLDVQPHHKVLDMCAAPGSKTAQLLELLHADEDIAVPSGYVIANDIDNKRCYMLVHQAKRLNSPCMAVINNDSAILPNFEVTLSDGESKQVQFDRILCDVPCSGDGTLRKNPDIWMKWTPANGINLHGIQSRIIRRGAELLALGGRLVYSTCSLNPVENEAVIHRLLNETDDALQLVDVSKSLPGLKYIPGLESWLVGSRNLEFYKTFDEVDEKWRTTIRPQMFPPKSEDKNKFHLDRCIRILPHQQNTGAFFVAVLEKLKPLNSKEKPFRNNSEQGNNVERADQDETEETNKNKRAFDERLPQNQRKRRRKSGYKEDPFVFFKDDEAVWPGIRDFYHIASDFDPKCLLVRCQAGKKKNIYFTSPAIRDLVTQNQNTIKFINTGVKTFVRSDNRNMKLCPFRIANDGLESIFNYVGSGRKVRIPKEDLIKILVNDVPEKSPPISTLSEDLQKQVADLSPGSCVLIYTEKNAEDEEPLILHISGWRGTTSLRCYMSQHSVVHLLRLLGEDVSKYEVNKFKKSEEAEEIDQNMENDETNQTK